MTFVLEKNMMLYIFRRAYSAFLALFFVLAISLILFVSFISLGKNFMQTLKY